MKFAVWAATLLSVAALGARPAAATLIPITNAGFESPTDNGVGTGAATGWVSSGGGAGVWNPNVMFNGTYFAAAPEGKQIGFVSSAPAPGSPATLSQTLTGFTLAPDSFYVLSGYVGHPTSFQSNNNGDTVFTISLFAGSSLLTSLNGTGPSGTFEKFSLAYTSSNVVPLGDLRIVLASNQAQTGFDDISLNVPDGGMTLSLLGLSMTGLAWARRKLR